MPEHIEPSDHNSPITGTSASAAASVFAAWLRASGFSTGVIQSRSSALRQVLTTFPEIPDGPQAILDHPAFDLIVGGAVSPRDVKELPGLLADHADDRHAMGLRSQFSFTEINPGIGSLGFGAELVGGIPSGSSMIAPIAAPSYEAFHGLGSLDAAVDPDIVMATLPFSVFTSGSRPDPEVSSLVETACGTARNSSAVLFRVDWTTATRMGIPPSGIVDLIRKFTPFGDVRHFVASNRHFVPMLGEELFVAASSKWKAPFRFVADGACNPNRSSHVAEAEHSGFAALDVDATATVFPSSPAGRIDVDYRHTPPAAVVKTPRGVRMLLPIEVASILGIPRHFVIPSDAETAYHLLGESVAVPVAERAIRSLMRAVELN